MGVRWMSDTHDNMSAIYDSTTDTAFGPVFYTAEGAGDFLTWYGERTPDLRRLSHDDICTLVTRWEKESSVQQDPLPDIPF